jgi:hypothetical protein
MSGRGFPSRGDAEVELSADGKRRGPDLPENYDWPAQTLVFWENWRHSAQARDMTPTDWDFMLDTAMLHAELWSGNGAVASELRLRVAKFGATIEDRQRMKMAIVEPEQTKKPARKPRGSTLRVVGAQAS